MRTPIIKIIFIAGLVAGTMDMVGALTVYAVLLHKASGMLILQRIASAAIGPAALRGGWATAWCGLLFHYFIAYSFTAAYVLLYPYLPLLRKNRLASGLLYGLLVWLIMNRIVLPLTKIQMAPFQWGAALIGIAILMLCIGLPIAYITDAYYKKRDVEAGSLELATASSSGGEQGARAGS
jgi:hypothetical protein